MRKLGLIGGTGPESTLVYYKEINRRVNERLGGKAFPELSIESVDLYKALGLVGDRKYDELKDYLLTCAKNLSNNNCEIISLTAGTMHVVYDEISKDLDAPMVSIPKTVAQYAKEKGITKVGLLGTIFTMENDFFSKAFVEDNIEVFVPEKDDRILINERISKELELGIVKKETQDELIGIIRKLMAKNGIEAIVLGCTELPLALNDNNCPTICLDIMDIHIDKLVDLILD